MEPCLQECCFTKKCCFAKCLAKCTANRTDNVPSSTVSHLIRVQLHQVLSDQVMQLRSNLHTSRPAPHNHKGQQLAPLLQRE